MWILWIAYTCLIFLEKAMAPHSSTLPWKIPWTEEPGGLQSLGSLRVRHDWLTSLSLLTFMHWRRKWQPTPLFWPGESQGRGSLVGCCLWDRRVRHDWSDLAAAAAASFFNVPFTDSFLKFGMFRSFKFKITIDIFRAYNYHFMMFLLPGFCGPVVWFSGLLFVCFAFFWVTSMLGIPLDTSVTFLSIWHLLAVTSGAVHT